MFRGWWLLLPMTPLGLALIATFIGILVFG